MRKINIPMHVIHIYIKHPVKGLIFRISVKWFNKKKIGLRLYKNVFWQIIYLPYLFNPPY